ncbi:MAG: YihY/virulence factor BrkB family protein, partial [candidate division Zixibacteria bacterium]|nr:YihY/virulence factor BrkB family protein [candidate division Zixibacteria bacterium]
MKKTLLKSTWEFISYYFGGLYQRINEHHLFLLSGGLAFSLIVCIIPFVLIIFSILGNVLQDSFLQSQVNSFIDRVIPYEDYASFAKNLILSRIEEFKIYKNIAGYVGVIGLLIAASGLFSSMRTILNRVYGTDKGKKFVIAKLRDLGMVLLVLGFFLISTA